MKKTLSAIIILIGLFPNTLTFAGDLSFTSTLNLEVGPEIFALNNMNLNEFEFKSSTLKNTYDQIVMIDDIFKKQIIKEFEAGSFEYYEVEGIMTDYRNFVYSTNELFEGINMLDKDPEAGYELLDKIEEDYRDVRAYHQKLQNIVKKGTKN